jgi:hypothetical protein
LPYTRPALAERVARVGQEEEKQEGIDTRGFAWLVSVALQCLGKIVGPFALLIWTAGGDPAKPNEQLLGQVSALELQWKMWQGFPEETQLFEN